jgi:hypothetical protein
MGKIFKGQTKLQTKLTLEQDISGATSVLIKYKKPSGTLGSWTATTITAATGVIGYEPAGPDTLDEVGQWTIWAYVTFSDSRVAAGEPVTMQVNKEG